jgi:hypothetical protein
MRGIFSMDPGGHTGLAWGIFDTSASIADALNNGIDKGSRTLEGDEHAQIEAIANIWVKFFRHCVEVRCLAPERVEFVSEDFVQRPGSSGGKEGQSPIRILWGVEGYRMGRAAEFAGRRGSKKRVIAPRIILQNPSLGSGVSRKMLESYGCWVIGREHERSAFKHIAVRLGRIHKTVS